MRCMWVIYVVVLAVLIGLSSSNALAIVYVDCTAPGPSHDGSSWDTAFLTIQQGVNAATPGGEVWVADGTYDEGVVMGESVALYSGFLGAQSGGYETSLEQRDFVNHVATIRGSSRRLCVLMASSARLDGLTVTNGSSGVMCQDLAEPVVIANCAIVDNLGSGLYCQRTTVDVMHCVVSGNDTDSRGGGMYFYRCAALVQDNVITNNMAEHEGGGVYCYYTTLLLLDNELRGNRGSGSSGTVYCEYPTVTISGNIIAESPNGGVLLVDSTGTVENNTIRDNRGTGIRCTRSSALIAGNTISGHVGYGQGVSSWRSSVVLESNTIAYNSNTGWGAGFYCSETMASLLDNTFEGNTADVGGAIYCGGEADVLLHRNAIRGNSATHGAGIFSGAGDALRVIECSITDNSAVYFGGGICCESTSPVVIGSTVSGNAARYGGGIMCIADASPDLSLNTIAGNFAELGGGICCSYSAPDLVNNVVAGNTASSDGGGIYCYNLASPTLTNNTIAANFAGREGGGICCSHGSSPVLANNVVAGNVAGDLGGGVRCCSAIILSHNDFWSNAPDDYNGCEPGEGDISADPLFVDPESGDYHLSVGSPCLDAGDNAAPGLPYRDIDDDPRVCDGDGDAVAVVDMGADEYREPYERNAAPRDWFVPGWVWFSIPLIPRGSADASDVLGFDCTNRVFGHTDWPKILLLYPDDFTDLRVGPSYVAYLHVGEAYAPVYEGSQPELPFGWSMLSAGWHWVGVPATQAIRGVDLALSKGGETRTAPEDAAAGDAWLNWNWIYWDPTAQTAGIMNPFGSGDDEWIRPWWGYRVWANTENVTIVLP